MKKNINIRSLVLCALFVALSVALKTANITLFAYLRLGFGLLPIVVCGLLLGPLWGFAAGALADVIGYFVFSWGMAYFPGYTLTYALCGLVPALIAGRFTMETDAAGHKRFVRRLRPVGFVNIALICLGIAVSQCANSALLNTLWLEITGQGKFFVMLPLRLLTQAALIPVFCLVSVAVLRLYMRIGKLEYIP